MAPGRGHQPAEARGLVAWLVRELGGVSLTAAAERLKRDLSSLSAAATRLERRAWQNPWLAQRCQRLRKSLQAKMAVNTHLQSLTFGPSGPPLSSPRLPLRLGRESFFCCRAGERSPRAGPARPRGGYSWAKPFITPCGSVVYT